MVVIINFALLMNGTKTRASEKIVTDSNSILIIVRVSNTLRMHDY